MTTVRYAKYCMYLYENVNGMPNRTRFLKALGMILTVPNFCRILRISVFKLKILFDNTGTMQFFE